MSITRTVTHEPAPHRQVKLPATVAGGDIRASHVATITSSTGVVEQCEWTDSNGRHVAYVCWAYEQPPVETDLRNVGIRRTMSEASALVNLEHELMRIQALA